MGHFSADGFDINFLDASPQYYTRERLDAYYAGDAAYRIVDPPPTPVETREQMWSAIQNLRQGDVVWHLSRFFKSVDDDYVFDMLEQKDIPYYLQHFDTMPSPVDLTQNLRMQIRMYRQKYINRRLKPRGVVGSGLIGRRQSQMLFPESKFLSIPSIKVLWGRSEKVVDGEYILFVDENIDYAPDANLLGYSISHDNDGYYRRMNQLFTLLETRWSKPVVVAASGKYKYQQDRFQGRSLVYGKTLPLIQHASLVVGHMSLALEQCLVSEVPFLIVDDQSFTAEKRTGFKLSLLNRIKKPILNTKVTQEILARCIDPETSKMRALVGNFLKEEGADTPFRKIVATAFKESWAKGYAGA